MAVEESLSPSMDIQVSSNFERLLFEFLGRDARLTAKTMADFRTSGKMAVPSAVWKAIKRDFTGFSLSDEATLAEIARTYREAKYLADPHTAIALAAVREKAPGRRAGHRRRHRAPGKIPGCDRTRRRIQAYSTAALKRPI